MEGPPVCLPSVGVMEGAPSAGDGGVPLDSALLLRKTHGVKTQDCKPV